MTAGKPIQRYIPHDLDVTRQEKLAVDEIWRKRVDGRWCGYDDKALLFIIQYKQIVSTLVWNPVQAREEQETPQIQKRGKYNHELYK